MNNLFDEYQDRKMLKWNGFYLSEHTASISKLEGEEAVVWPAKEKMTGEEINQVLTFAKMKNFSVAIQKEELDVEGHHLPDVVGRITGFDSIGVYIGNKKIAYESIRNAEIVEVKKWSELG